MVLSWSMVPTDMTFSRELTDWHGEDTDIIVYAAQIPSQLNITLSSSLASNFSSSSITSALNSAISSLIGLGSVQALIKSCCNISRILFKDK